MRQHFLPQPPPIPLSTSRRSSAGGGGGPPPSGSRRNSQSSPGGGGNKGYGSGPPRGPVARLSGGASGEYEHQGSYLSRNSSQVHCLSAETKACGGPAACGSVEHESASTCSCPLLRSKSGTLQQLFVCAFTCRHLCSPATPDLGPSLRRCVILC